MSHQRRIDRYDYKNTSSDVDQLPPARPNSPSSDKSVDMIQMHRQPAPPPRPPSARRRQSTGRRASGVRPPSRSLSHYGDLDPESTSFDHGMDLYSRPPSSISSRPSSSLSKYNPLPPIGHNDIGINNSDWSVSNAVDPDRVTRSFDHLRMDVWLPSKDADNTDRIPDSSPRNCHQDLTKLETEEMMEKNSSQTSHVSFFHNENEREHTPRCTINNLSPKTRLVSDEVSYSNTGDINHHSSAVSNPAISPEESIDLSNADFETKSNVTVTTDTVVCVDEKIESLVPNSETLKNVTQNILPSEPGEGENRLLLAFKLPDGKRFQRYFRVSDTMGLVLKFVENSSGLNMENFNLVCNSPKTLYSDREQTLASSGLKDRTLLYLDEKD